MTSMQYHVSSGIMEPVNCVQVFYMVCYEQHRPPVPEDTPPEYVALLTKVRTSVPCTFHSPPCQLSCVLWVGGLCLALTAIMLLDTMLRYHARMFAETSFPITQCWEHDPTQRPTFSYIMKTLMDQFSVLRAAKPPAAAATITMAADSLPVRANSETQNEPAKALPTPPIKIVPSA